MKNFDDVDQLQGCQNRDMENAMLWWAETSNKIKLKVWMDLQEFDDHPFGEIVLRFAQIGMTHVAIEALERK